MLVRVIVDPDACIGSAECVALDPEAVELDEHGTARMLVPSSKRSAPASSATPAPRRALGRRREWVMDTIVVGVDGSEKSKDALRFALDEARRWGAKLHVVHAFWEWEPIPGTEEIEQERDEQERDAWLAALVREVAGEVADVEIVSSTVETDAAPALLAAAQSAELLVVGSRGHGGLGELLLGSVSQQCALHASCPVVIVRGSDGSR